MRRAGLRGFSLVELLVASVLASVVAAGTMASLAASARIARRHNATTMADAGGYATQLLEQFRNNVAADDTTFSGKAGNPGACGASQTDRDFTSASDLSLSVAEQVIPGSTTRDYCVARFDCNGDGCVNNGASCTGVCPGGCAANPVDNCYAVTTNLTWR